MKTLNNFDFTLNEAKNMVLHKLATAPSGIEGQIFYNTATKKVNVNNGTVFMEIGVQEIATTSTPGIIMVGNGLKIDALGKMELDILDGSNLIKTEYLPSYVDDVLEFQNFSSLPVTGEQGKIYVTTDDNTTYRWTGTTYIGLSNPLDYATQAEAEAGTNNTKVMTPQRVKESILVNAPMKLDAYRILSSPLCSQTHFTFIKEFSSQTPIYLNAVYHMVSVNDTIILFYKIKRKTFQNHLT